METSVVYERGLDDLDGDGAQEVPDRQPTFEELGLPAAVLRAVADLGYEEPTPVQAALVPLMRSGLDLIIQSRTGTGKTAAFGLPIVERLSGDDPHVRALAITPTRELALQVAAEIDALGCHKAIRTATVYGGVALQPQIRAIEKAQVVVGTPGRLLDHLQRGTLRLDGVGICVLDEADEMLSMGFLEDVEAILQRLPEQRQFVLTSATIAPDILRLSERYMTAPEFVSLSTDNVAATQVDHSYYVVLGTNRQRDLLRVIEQEQVGNALIFCNTRADSARVARALRLQGHDAEVINGDLAQRDREAIMSRCKAGDLRFMVATDVAARGIDISHLSHVINYQLPDQAELYIHRTGRTGRAGRSGRAVSLVSPQEMGTFYFLRKQYPLEMKFKELPAIEEADNPFAGVLARELERDAKIVDRGPYTPRDPSDCDDGGERGRGGRGPRGRGGRDDRRGERSRGPSQRDGERGGRGRERSRPRRDEGPPRGDEAPRQRASAPQEATGASEGRPRRRRRRVTELEGLPPAVMPALAVAGEGLATPSPAEDTSPASELAGAPEGAPPRARRPRRRRGRSAVPEGMVRLHFNVGEERLEGGASELVALLAERGGVDATVVGTVDLHRGFSFVNVAVDAAEGLVAQLVGQELDGVSLRLEPARSPTTEK